MSRPPKRSLIARLFGLAIVIAAGFGGWFFASGFIDALDPSSSWSDIDITTDPWGSFAAQSDSLLVSHDVEQGTTRVEGNDPPKIIEFAGKRSWERIGDGAWQQSADDANGPFLLSVSEPRLITTAVPPRAEPFATVTRLDDDEDGFAVFRVVVESIDFFNADPLAHRRWRTDVLGFDAAPLAFNQTERWVLTVRDDGYIVKWPDRFESDWLWTEQVGPLALESPLAPR